MSTGCKSSHNGFLDVSRSNGGLSISGWIGTLKLQNNSNTVIGTLAVDVWAVTFDIARRGLGGLWPTDSLLAVPNVTAHRSTASVPPKYYPMWHENCLCTLNLKD